MESHPQLERVPDQSLIIENNNTPAERVQAAKGNDYAFIYTAAGKSFTVVLSKLKAAKIHAYWYNPRNGKTTDIGIMNNLTTRKFIPPTNGYGNDWVLVFDDDAKHYAML